MYRKLARYSVVGKIWEENQKQNTGFQQRPYGSAPSRSRRSGPAVARVEESAKLRGRVRHREQAASEPDERAEQEEGQRAGRPAPSTQSSTGASDHESVIELQLSEASGQSSGGARRVAGVAVERGELRGWIAAAAAHARGAAS